ncbi:MAG TPA: YciI family protein [Pseudonocardiaceae bacterium]|jgi:uncharacterized protein YciI|nr:YciI family protein [Pseudonocardiaceae bacterium]
MAWYLVIRRRTEPPADPAVTVKRHLEWMRAQHDAGTVVISGPAADRQTGIYVMRCGSCSEAAAIAAGDPLAEDGRAGIEVIEWHVHQMLGVGSFDFAVCSDDMPESQRAS